MSRYLVPKAPCRVEYRQSNSRFIATIGPAGSQEEARAFIHSIREEMPGATHHVYAFRVGFGSSVTEGMSDDGEPSGTSGPPALAVLRGSELGDVVLVITRFFGGTKLGTGGLVAAYGNAAKMAVEAVERIEKVERRMVALSLPYPLYDRVSQFLSERSALVDRTDFGITIEMEFRFPLESMEELEEFVRDVSGGKVAPVVREGD